MLSALGQSTRLETFELLMKSEPKGLPAGDVARRLAIPQNTLSAHLATLYRAGLVRAERQGRSIIYRAEPNQLLALATFLSQGFATARRRRRARRGKAHQDE